MTSRSSNEAGLAGLSAFWVANNRSNRAGRPGFSCKAEAAICRWARVGGLKEESSTYSTEGHCGRLAGTEERISKFFEEEMKRLQAAL